MKPFPKLLSIVGPTGTGKTLLAIRLAKKFDGEIISADSRQVYIGMDIGTGKEVELLGKGGVPIHLYDVVLPNQSFTLVDFQQLAVQKIEEITRRGKLALMVGGTGLYIQAIVDGLKIPKAPPDIKLREKLSLKSTEELFKELSLVDPSSAENIDAKNQRRIIRALEVFYSTGKSILSLKEKFNPKMDVLMIGLTADRETLYKKNDLRVEEWFKLGFVEEVRTLLKKFPPDLPSLSALGYGQVGEYLNNRISLEKAKERIKFAIHNFIRKQLSWFKADDRVVWFDIENPSLLNEVEDLIQAWYTQK